MDDIRSRPTGATVSIQYASGLHCLEAGAGPLVVLVHSSMAGARQWSSLISRLETEFFVRAVNLFGYGRTPAWSGSQPPSLDDFAELIAEAIPGTVSSVHLVGHSLGGAVAMRAAAQQLRGRIGSLVLIEPSLFSLLDHGGRHEAYYEITELLMQTSQAIAAGNLDAAAERFVDYWWGPGAWAATPAARRLSLTRMTELLPREAAALLRATAEPDAWIAGLPRDTLVISSGKTTRPSREIVELLLQARPDWARASISEAGHMGPVSHPHLINRIIRTFIADRAMRWQPSLI